MSESIRISSDLSKEGIYLELLPQIESLLDEKWGLISNLANTAAALKEAFGFFWVGFYLINGDKLSLGPFQGPVACTTIGKGKGVCGKSWQNLETIVVEDVNLFPGHISCNDASKSEIVVPIFNKRGEFVGVLDVDSDIIGNFDDVDKKYLEQIVALIPS